jgi:hypothetical protein
MKVEPTALVLAVFVAAVLAGLFVRFGSSVMPTSKESFMQQPVGKPLNSGGMGPYDQVDMGSGVAGWAANEAASIGGASNLPSQAAEPNKFMLMVGNKVDSECCPSPFNTDSGCVCLTQENRNMMASRGGNRA